jgi:hypothetical protein
LVRIQVPQPYTNESAGSQGRLREILTGFADIGQTIDLGDRDLEAASVDQARKF